MMSAKIIDGKRIAAEIRIKLAQRVQGFQKSQGYVPQLVVILVGENPASMVYVRSKEKACVEVGMRSRVIRLPEETKQTELLALIEELNRDENVHGILVQLPLPKHMNELQVIQTISPLKDVDGFHLQNAGALMVGAPGLVSCTPKGCMALIESTNQTIDGKEVVVVGRSNIVGKPVAMLLLEKNATVTICHSHTKNLAEVIKRADILVAAVGRPKMVTADMVKPGAIVIDVGINRMEDGKLCGDVDFDGVSQISSYITPVPGGVGPMTIAMLLENTLQAAENDQ